MAFPRAGALLLAIAGLLTVGAGGQSPNVPASGPSHVWIFCGTPGDDEHHAAYEKLLARLRNSLMNRYGLSASGLTVLYGPVEAGYNGECTRAALLAELSNVCTCTQTPGTAP